MSTETCARETRPPVARDGGFTLIELLVTMGLLVIVVSVTGTILINGLRVQAKEQGIASGTGSAQSLSRSIGRGIGNASSVTVETATAAGQLLHARVVSTTSSGTTAAVCEAWYYSQTYSSLFTTTGSALTAVPTITSATVAPAGWTVLAAGVGAPSHTPFTQPSSNQVAVNLTVSAGAGAPPIVVDTTIGTSAQSDTTSLPTSC